MNKPVIEQELIDSARGERVTLQAVESAIMSAHYFTARQGARAAALDTAVENGGMPDLSFINEDLGLLTICVLHLWNGFTVLGQSACADPKNFNEEIGRRIAREDAVKKIWPLMGYELKSRIARDARLVGGAPVDVRPGAGYIGTKVVNAEPMNRLAYNQLRGWQLPAGEDANDEGYLVEYTDRVENPPHVPGFKGYVSWSPKEVFERAYRPVRAAEAQPAAASAEGTGEASQISGTKPLIVILDEVSEIEKDRLWQEAIKSGHKIDAIREYRHAHKATLKVAKEAVEAWHEKNAETWLDRAKLELAQLTERYDKLEEFLRTETFERLPSVDRKDLYVQVNAMEGYKHALAKRVARAELNNSMAAQRDAQQAQRQQFQNKAAD